MWFVDDLFFDFEYLMLSRIRDINKNNFSYSDMNS